MTQTILEGEVSLSKTASNSVIGEVVATLEEILQEGLDIHRTLAAKALGNIGGAQVVSVLVKALLDEDEDVRSDASQALSLLADSSAAKPLMENLIGDPVLQVKLNAIDGLARMGYKPAVILLQKLATERDEEIVWDEQEEAESGWEGWLDVQLYAIRALGKLKAEQAVDDIVTAIDDEFAQDVSAVGFDALRQLGPAGIKALGNYLDSPRAQLQRRAALNLMKTSGADFDEAFRLIDGHKDADVRYVAAEFLTKQDPHDKKLALFITDQAPKIRAMAVKSALSLELITLDDVLDDGAIQVRNEGLAWIAAHGGDQYDKDIVEKVSKFLDEGARSSVMAAAGAFGAIGGMEAMERLAAIMQNGDQDLLVRQSAQKAIAQGAHEQRVEDEWAARMLSSVLEDTERQLRLEAMAELTKLAKHATWPNAAGDLLLLAASGALVEAPEKDEDEEEPADDRDGSPEQREDLAEDEQPGEAFVPLSTLDSILQDEKPLAKAFRQRSTSDGLSPKDLDYLRLSKEKKLSKKRLSPDFEISPHIDVRQFAARLLGDIAHRDVVMALLAMVAGGDAELSEIAADSLSKIHIELENQDRNLISNTLIEQLPLAPCNKRLSMVRGLRQFGNDKAVEALQDLLSDEDSFVQVEVLHALAALNIEPDGLTDLLDDILPRVRLAAAKALTGTDRDDKLEKLVGFTLSYNGYHSFEGAKLLRQTNAGKASEYLLITLRDEAQKEQWKPAIEALDIINARSKEVTGV